MGITYTTVLTIDDNFDHRKATARDVRFGFLVHLPFRLRLGNLYHDSFLNQYGHFSLWLLNRIDLAPDKPATMQLPTDKSISDLCTEALVVQEDQVVSEEALELLRQSPPEAEIKSYPAATGEMLFHVMDFLNNFIIGYATATKQLFGGFPLRIFRTHDFFDFLRWQLTILGPQSETIDTAAARKIFDLKPDRELRDVGTLTGELYNLPDDSVTQIRRAIELHQDFPFYEITFEAKTKMVAGDYVGALLMAIAALEGVHAAYVHEVLTEKLPKEAEHSLVDDFLRQLGMKLCNQLTPYVFMEPHERPTGEIIAKTEKAINFRNEIAHSLRKRSGTYRARTRTNQELSDAYSAALTMFECYRSAFERLATEQRK